MITCKGFEGLVSVWTIEKSVIDGADRVEINWPSIRAASIARAQEFSAAMTEAITYAKAEEERLGIRQGDMK